MAVYTDYIVQEIKQNLKECADTPKEILELEQGFRTDALQQEQEEQEANDNGYCIHCGEELENCTGYKCWI